MSNVLPFRQRVSTDAASVLQQAADTQMQEVLLVGYAPNGDFIMMSSGITHAESVFLLESAKLKLLTPGAL